MKLIWYVTGKLKARAVNNVWLLLSQSRTHTLSPVSWTMRSVWAFPAALRYKVCSEYPSLWVQ